MEKDRIAISGKEMFYLGTKHPLGESFVDFLELDLTTYEKRRLNIIAVLKNNDIETMKDFTKNLKPPKNFQRGFDSLYYELLNITEDMSLERKYVVFAVYKALQKIEHVYIDIMDYSGMCRIYSENLLELVDLLSFQKEYKDAMVHCLFNGNTKQNAVMRLRKYEGKITGKAEVEFVIDGETLSEVFTASSITSLLYVEFMKMVQNDVSVRECQKCHKNFVVKGKYDMKYCEREVNGEKVCQKNGAIETFKSKVRENDIYKEYEKVYKRFYARKRRGIITQEQFNTWLKKATKLKKDALTNALSEDEFKTQISNI